MMFTQAFHEGFMRQALREAVKAAQAGGMKRRICAKSCLKYSGAMQKKL
jgi:hypothetical protein